MLIRNIVLQSYLMWFWGCHYQQIILMFKFFNVYNKIQRKEIKAVPTLTFDFFENKILSTFSYFCLSIFYTVYYIKAPFLNNTYLIVQQQKNNAIRSKYHLW